MSRVLATLLAGAALLPSSGALAADQLKFGPAPVWVVPAAPPATVPSSDAPIAMLLNDQQISMEPGHIVTYSETVMRIQNPQGLAAGNISLSWNPATEIVTIHKLQVRRGDKIIDVLASGQTFTTLRRETNLDAAMLDGTLTANIQPEGLQVGDIIDMAATNEHSDPVLKGHVEGVYAAWNGVPFESARARLSWPTATQMNTRQAAGLPSARMTRLGNTTVLELTGKNIQPLIAPKGAPPRFGIGRFGEATDFHSWSQVADLFAPLYRDASMIATSGSLRDELNRIKGSTNDPKSRAEQALRLVQDRTRYVALLMGQGSFVPAPAEETWKRRFGDCKAKTALLLGLLHELGVEAEPVLVNASVGDVVADRLPMVQYFDHVLVRAHIGGKTYWLDGTRSGDRSLDQIDVPGFTWGLPLIANAKLVSIVPPPLDLPETETIAVIDASKGAYAPASLTVDQAFRGDSAIVMNNAVKSFSEGQRQEFFNQYWRGNYDFVTPGPTTAAFDDVKKIYRFSMKGEGKLDWHDRYFHVPDSSVGYSPNFDRPAGPLHDAPLAVKFPYYVRNVTTVRFPPGFFGSRRPGTTPTTQETLAGMEYRMSATTVSGSAADTVTVESSARALVPEIPYKDGLAAAARLRELSDQDVALPLPQSYRETPADMAAMIGEEPTTLDQFTIRGNALLNAGKLEEAIADFTKALGLDPKSGYSLASRGAAYVWKKDYAAAERDFSAAEKLDPTNSVVLRGRALMAEQQGDTRKAIEVYSKSLAKDPSDGFALFHRSMLYRSTWKYNEAIKDLTSIVDANPKNASAFAFRAQAYADIGDEAAAQRDLQTARALDPNEGALKYAEAYLAKRNRNSNAELDAYTKLIKSSTQKGPFLSERASTYLRLHRYDEALADTDQALKLGYNGAELRVVRANVFMHSNKRAAVAAEAEAMVRENPTSVYAFVAAGKTYAALGLREKAMETFSRALAIRPDSMVYINRADVRPYTDLDGRLSDLDEALKLDPNSVDAIVSKARQLMLKGDYAQAEQLYDRAAAIETDPDNTIIPLGRSRALYKAGRRTEAEQILAKLRGKAKSAGDFSSLCWVGANGEMFLDQALRDCDQAIKLDPKSAVAGKGLVLLRLGRLNEAITQFDQALAQDRNAFNLMARAIAYAKKGKIAASKADHAEALKLNPDEDSDFAEIGLKLEYS